MTLGWLAASGPDRRAGAKPVRQRRLWCVPGNERQPAQLNKTSWGMAQRWLLGGGGGGGGQAARQSPGARLGREVPGGGQQKAEPPKGPQMGCCRRELHGEGSLYTLFWAGPVP